MDCVIHQTHVRKTSAEGGQQGVTYHQQVRQEQTAEKDMYMHAQTQPVHSGQIRQSGPPVKPGSGQGSSPVKRPHVQYGGGPAGLPEPMILTQRSRGTKRHYEQ